MNKSVLTVSGPYTHEGLTIFLFHGADQVDGGGARHGGLTVGAATAVRADGPATATATARGGRPRAVAEQRTARVARWPEFRVAR